MTLVNAGQTWKITKGKYNNYHVLVHHTIALPNIGTCINISVPEAKISHMPFSLEHLKIQIFN